MSAWLEGPPFMHCDQHADPRRGQGFERHLGQQEVEKGKGESWLKKWTQECPWQRSWHWGWILLRPPPLPPEPAESPTGRCNFILPSAQPLRRDGDPQSHKPLPRRLCSLVWLGWSSSARCWLPPTPNPLFPERERKESRDLHSPHESTVSEVTIEGNHHWNPRPWSPVVVLSL